MNTNKNQSVAPSVQAAQPEMSFNQMADTLKAAIAEFEKQQSPEALAGIVSALSSFGLSGADIWKKAAAYTRENPVRVAAAVGILFFAYKGLMRDPRVGTPDLH